MKFIKLPLILLCVLITLLAGCTMNRYVTKIHMSEPYSYTETLSFEDDGNYRTVNLEINLDFSEGEASFIALNPHGDELWSDTLEGRQKIRNKYQPAKGLWTLEITVTDAVGTIEAAWRPVR